MTTPTRGRRAMRVAFETRAQLLSIRQLARTLLRDGPRRMRGLLALGAGALLLAAAPSTALAQPDLVLNVTDAPDPVPATGIVTYSVNVSNNGITTATGVNYVMNVPATATYQTFTAPGGTTCSGMTVGQVGPGVVTCTTPNIAFANSVAFSIQLKLNAQGSINVVQTVASSVADADTGNNTVTSTTTVSAGADVVMTVSAPSTAVSGSTYSYLLGISNNGPDAATRQRVTFPVPTGFTVTGALPAGCSTSGTNILCDVAGPIAAASSFSIGNITGVISVASGSSLVVVPSVALQPGAPALTPRDPNTVNNSFTQTTSITAGSDLKMAKARSVGGPYFVGGTFNFVLTPSFTGDSPSGLTITDVVPTNYTIGTVAPSQSGWACSVSGQTVTCTRANGGGTAGANISLGTITIPVTVNAPGASVTNSASINATSPSDPNTLNNSASDGGTTLLTPSADIAIAKSGPSPALAVIGVPFDWTLTSSNGGPSVFFGQLVMTDTVPAGITITAVAANGWSCSAPAPGPSVLTCTRTYTSGAPLTSGTSAPLVVLTATSSVNGSVTNRAAITTVSPNVPDPNSGNNVASYTVGVATGSASADLRVIKTVDLATVPAGNVLTYTLEVLNAGPDTSRTIDVTDDLQNLINSGSGPTGQGLVSVTVLSAGNAVGAITCSSSPSGSTGRAVSCTIPKLPVCSAGVNCPRISIAVRPGGDGGSRGNSATAISSVTADPSLTNNTGSTTNTVDARADVSITKVGSPSTVPAGQELTYVLTAPNTGPSTAGNVTVTDVLPLNVLFVSAMPAAGSCGTTPTANTVTTSISRTVTCNLGSVGNGGQQTVTVVVKPTTATRATTLLNKASVTTSTTQPPGADVNDTTSQSTPVIAPSLDLIINKSESVDPVAVGNNTVYTVRVNNDGPSDAENVVITDNLPTAGLSFQSVSITGGSCSAVPAVNSFGGTLTCSFPRVAANGTQAFTVTMKGTTKGIYTNAASVVSDESLNGFDFNTVNNNTTENTTVRTVADVEVVSKVPSVSSIAVRRPYSWTIQVRNNVGTGLSEADNVVITDNLPVGMELTGTPTVSLPVPGTATLSSCTGVAGGTTFSCVLGTFNNGAIANILVPVKNTSVPSGGRTVNTASITTSSLDPVPSNNAKTDSTTVTGGSISGIVFRDFANNGSIDVGDTGISTVGLTVTGTAFDGATITVSPTTDGNGLFTAAGLAEGTYKITRGTVSEAFLVQGQQILGSAGGNAAVAPDISGIVLGENVAATDYRFAFIPQARIGVAKRVIGTPVANTDGTLTAVLRIAVRNYSLETLNSVTAADPLTGSAPLFGSYVSGGSSATLTAGSYTINAAPSINGTCAGGTANAAFNGNGTTNVASITSLASGVTCEFDFTLRYRPTVPLPAGNYTNQATAAGAGALSGQNVTDQSQNGANPDTDGDNDPTNNNTRTPLNAVLAADVTTAVTLPSASIAAGSTVNGTALYRNTGPYTASGMTYTMSLSTNLTGGVTFGNLPSGATASYDASSGAVTFTGMPTTLTAGQIASGDGSTPITLVYAQSALGTSTLSTTIATTTNEGQNLQPNSSTATVTGPLIVDVTTGVTFPTTVNAGQLVSGTILFRNAGPSVASSVGYTLTLSTGLSGVTFGNLPSGASAAYNSTTGVVTFTGMPATVNPGAIVSGNGTSAITLSYTQPPSGNSNVASGISTTTSQGTNALPDAATTPIGGVPIADVTTSLVFPTTVNAGQPVNGTITFRNDGPSTAAGVTYTLTLTTGLSGVTFGNLPTGATATYNSATGVVTFTGFPVTVTANQLVSGNGTSPITLTYTQPGTAVSTITSGIGTTTNQGANVGLDAAFASPGGGLIADVRALVAAPTSVDAGGTVNSAITFSNLGPSIASGVTYSATMTAGLTNVVFGNLPTGATATYNSSTGAVTFTGMPATLASGAMASGNGTSGITVSFTQTANATSTITAVIGTSTSQGANIAPDTDSKTITGGLIADVTTALNGFPTLVAPGGSVAGTLTFRNQGPSAAAGVTYGVTLAAGLTNVAFTNLPTGAAAVYNASTGAIAFTGMPATVGVGVTVSGNGTAPIGVSYTQSSALQTAIASVIGTTTNQGVNTLPDAASVSVSGLQGTDLVITKTAAVTEVTPVDTITYTVRARNNGPVALPLGSILTDTPVNGISLTSVVCSTVAGNLCTSAPTTGALLAGASLPALPVSGVYEVLVRAAVTAPNGGTITNRARGGLPVGYFDTDSTNNQATVGPLTVRARPDVAVRKSVDTDTLRIGGVANYIVSVVNRGTAITSGNVVVTETLPVGLVPTAATSPNFTCTIAGQTVTCTRTSLMAVGDSTRITIATSITPAAITPTLTTTACQNTPDDVNATNDCDTVSRPVSGRREASFRKEAVGEFIVGQAGNFRLWVRNTGTIPLTGPLTIVDTLPLSLTYRSATGAAWSCAQATGVITCNTPGPLAVGDSTSVNVSTTVGTAAVPEVTNCATLSVTGGAVLANNGRACATVAARGDYRLVLELTTPRYDRELQDVPDFTVILRNIGLSPLTDVQLTNLLPRGFTYVTGTSARGGAPDASSRQSIVDPTTGANNTITWRLGTMLPGAVVRVDYRALIGVGATFNKDNITISSAFSPIPGLRVTSNTAQVPIRLRKGLFDNRGTIAGKLYIECNCNRIAGQDSSEVGIPGVRVLMEDGTGAITDVEGKFNFINVRAGLHVVKVDQSTLPAGAQLIAINTRNAGDGGSRFVDLKAGELARADFAEGSRSAQVLSLVLARRRAGEVNAAGQSDRLLTQASEQMQSGTGAWCGNKYCCCIGPHDVCPAGACQRAARWQLIVASVTAARTGGACQRTAQRDGSSASGVDAGQGRTPCRWPRGVACDGARGRWHGPAGEGQCAGDTGSQRGWLADGGCRWRREGYAGGGHGWRRHVLPHRAECAGEG
jgi:uncharacterized repeat protein (TIGR01451 family)